ncbi:hypothetical protein BH11PSE4_BH11PSE4_13650 [soil metagenome]
MRGAEFPTPSAPSRKISGEDARSLIEAQLAAHGDGVLAVLGRYRLADAVAAWHGTIRAVEEFINLPRFGIDDPRVRARLCSISLDDRLLSNVESVFRAVREILSPRFDADVVGRYLQTMLQTAAIASAFKMHGQAFGPGITLDTVGAAVDYFQSRRRHMVSLLYTMPFACKGTDRLVPLDTLNVLLPQVEHSCITITGFHLKLAQLDILDDFSLEVDGIGAMASHGFDTLDENFLEPERASIHVMAELRRDQIVLPPMEALDPHKIFSAAELRNSVRLIGATYAAFGLNDSDFSTMALLMIAFARQARDDYFIEIGKARFQAMLRAQSVLDPDELERLLVNMPSDYATNSNAYEPFIDTGYMVVSNVNLLSRFLYAFKNVHLGSRRRFQIHAGFIFEDMVKRDLSVMGFQVTDVKRINRKEFDVVTIHSGVIYNFQCKNNWIDLAKVESNRTLFVRYNRSLTSYYRRALQKERKREGLLKDKLGLDKVEHYLISRFPVIGSDARVINYNQIDRLKAVVGGAA